MKITSRFRSVLMSVLAISAIAVASSSFAGPRGLSLFIEGPGYSVDYGHCHCTYHGSYFYTGSYYAPIYYRHYEPVYVIPESHVVHHVHHVYHDDDNEYFDDYYDEDYYDRDEAYSRKGYR